MKALSALIDNKVVKKNVYDKLVEKVNAIKSADTSNLPKKDDYRTKIDKIAKKI